MADEWEEVPAGGSIWLPEKAGDVLIGEVLSRRDGNYGPQWLIKRGEKDELYTPSHKVLQARMENVAIGAIVRIEKLEAVPPKVRGQNPTTMYKVSVKK